MNEDLLRLKSLLETGKTKAKGQTVTRDKLEGVARTLVPGEMTRRWEWPADGLLERRPSAG